MRLSVLPMQWIAEASYNICLYDFMSAEVLSGNYKTESLFSAYCMFANVKLILRLILTAVHAKKNKLMFLPWKCFCTFWLINDKISFCSSYFICTTLLHTGTLSSSDIECTSLFLSHFLAVRYQGDYDAWIFPFSCGYPAAATNLISLLHYTKGNKKEESNSHVVCFGCSLGRSGRQIWHNSAVS